MNTGLQEIDGVISALESPELGPDPRDGFREERQWAEAGPTIDKPLLETITAGNALPSTHFQISTRDRSTEGEAFFRRTLGQKKCITNVVSRIAGGRLQKGLAPFPRRRIGGISVRPITRFVISESGNASDPSSPYWLLAISRPRKSIAQPLTIFAGLRVRR